MSALPKARTARQLVRLNAITTGSGAVKLPPTVTGINLSFKVQNSNGHQGPRKFWRESLPQIQFYNPSLPISVNRTFASTPEEQAKTPAVLTIGFADGSKKTINAQFKHSEAILEEFIVATKAQAVPEEELIVIKKPERAL